MSKLDELMVDTDDIQAKLWISTDGFGFYVNMQILRQAAWSTDQHKDKYPKPSWSYRLKDGTVMILKSHTYPDIWNINEFPYAGDIYLRGTHTAYDERATASAMFNHKDDAWVRMCNLAEALEMHSLSQIEGVPD